MDQLSVPIGSCSYVHKALLRTGGGDHARVSYRSEESIVKILNPCTYRPFLDREGTELESVPYGSAESVPYGLVESIVKILIPCTE